MDLFLKKSHNQTPLENKNGPISLILAERVLSISFRQGLWHRVEMETVFVLIQNSREELTFSLALAPSEAEIFAVYSKWIGTGQREGPLQGLTGSSW